MVAELEVKYGGFRRRFETRIREHGCHWRSQFFVADFPECPLHDDDILGLVFIHPVTPYAARDLDEASLRTRLKDGPVKIVVATCFFH
ncbi:hypothetical protein GOB57_09340 [Sinorhizobium meliloti]|nr:hypothetical protein [Sinorhizobium meliloti]